MRLIQLIISINMLLVTNCKSPKPAAEEPSKPTLSTAAPHDPVVSEAVSSDAVSPQEMQNSNDNVYRFIVSFISIGEGPDRNAKQILDSTLATWESKTKISYDTFPWGREGETDFCFQLKELNPKDQVRFVNDMKNNFKGHDLVQFSENEPCRHKR